MLGVKKYSPPFSVTADSKLIRTRSAFLHICRAGPGGNCDETALGPTTKSG